MRNSSSRAAVMAAVLLGGCGGGGDAAGGADRRVSWDAARDAAEADGAPAPDGPAGPDATPPSDATPPDAPARDADPPDGPLPPRPLSEAPHPVFDHSVLHIVDIQVAQADLNRLERDWEHRVPCAFTFDGEVVPRAGIRQKGGAGSGSNLGGKPGFSVRFDQFESTRLFGLRRLRLNNALQDPSLLREHLGYAFYRAAGVPAARTSHGWVTFNGRVLGLYVLAEAVDEQFLQAAFGEDAGNLYEGEPGVDFAGIVDGVDGASRLELDDEEGRSRDDLRALGAAVRDGDIDRIAAALDLDTLFSGWAIDAALGHDDDFFFSLNNYFLYHRAADDRFALLPHGMDRWLLDMRQSPFARPLAALGALYASPSVAPAEGSERFRRRLARFVETDWDVADPERRLDEAVGVLESAPVLESETQAQLAAFEEALPDLRQGLSERRRTLREALAARCGDGRQEGLEACDDGNTEPGDGCSADCVAEICGDNVVQVDLGEACDGAGCKVDCSGPVVCGDGTTDPGEECDDHNDTPFDGCTGCRNDTCVRPPSMPGWLICTTPMDFATAREACLAHGAALGLPETQDENFALIAASLRTERQPYWLDLTDAAVEGEFRRGDGSVPGYTGFAPDRPNGGTEQNCVAIDPILGGSWDDYPCDEVCGAVCRVGP